jgi:hypothetical protein
MLSKESMLDARYKFVYFESIEENAGGLSAFLHACSGGELEDVWHGEQRDGLGLMVVEKNEMDEDGRLLGCVQTLVRAK